MLCRMQYNYSHEAVHSEYVCPIQSEWLPFIAPQLIEEICA